jgi:hypothetical protein
MDIRGGDVVAVHGTQVIHDGLAHRRIDLSQQQIDVGARHIAGRVDVVFAGPGIHHGQQLGQVARAGVRHAQADQNGDAPLRAVHRATCDDAGTLLDSLRVRKMYLRRHVHAGRKAGYRDVVDADVVVWEVMSVPSALALSNLARMATPINFATRVWALMLSQLVMVM